MRTKTGHGIGVRVLVTGASGYVGGAIAHALVAAGHEAIGLARRPSDRAGLPMLMADLMTEGAALAAVEKVRPDVIVHAAWYSAHGRFWEAPENLDWVGASLRLARAGAQIGLTRFVGVGTCAEYEGTETAPRHEFGSRIAPASLYGEAKAATGRLIDRYARNARFAFAWGRVFFPFGGAEPEGKLVPSLARAMIAGRPAEMGSGLAERDFIHLDDVGEAIARLAVSAVEGPVNIGTGAAVRLKTIGERMAVLAGRPDLLCTGARADPAGEPRSLVADATRLTREVGFTPRLSLDEGLQRALDHWRAKVARS